jgi:membrane-associated protease RseP (regulator of RpoE activity)
MSWVAALVLVYVNVVIHEAGHYAVAKAVNVRAFRLQIGFGPELVSVTTSRSLKLSFCLLPIGGFMDCGEQKIPLSQQISVLAAGPLANIGLGIAFHLAASGDLNFAFSSMTDQASGMPSALFLSAIACYIFGVFNLAPILPLDGGLILLNILNAWGIASRPSHLKRFNQIGHVVLAAATAAAFILFAWQLSLQ